MTVTGFCLTPSMSGIFDLVNIYKYRGSVQISRNNLRSAEYLNGAFSTELLYLGWVDPNSDYAYITNGYALLPFQKPEEVKAGDRWTGETILYEADMNCSPAKMVQTTYGYNITNGEDCSYHFIRPNAASMPGAWDGTGLSVAEGLEAINKFPMNKTGKYNLFMGYNNNTRERPLDLFSLSSPLANCSDRRKILITRDGYWLPETSSFGTNTKPKFCKPTYWSQPVNITVMTNQINEVVVNVDRRYVGQRTPFKDFNITGFEELVVAGRASRESLFGHFPSAGPHSSYHGPMLNSWSLELIAYENSADFETTFKKLFALAVNSVFINQDQNSTTVVNGTHQIGMRAYVANELWCRLSQGGLGFLVVLTLSLLVVTWGRKCNLDGEPNSLAALMQTLSQSPALRSKMESSEFRHPIDQHEFLIETKGIYKLRLQNNQGPYIEVKDPKGKTVKLQDLNDGPAQTSGLTPVEMVWGPIGFLYTAYFTVLLALLLFVFISDKTKGGLQTSESESSPKYKLVFSHLPTIFGTSSEPLWVLIGTYACMVAPYEILRRGRAPSSKTLTVDYDKTPPHFQTFQALKTGNFGLAALTTAIILANLLAVALGGLFFPYPIESFIHSDYMPYTLNLSSIKFISDESYIYLLSELSRNSSGPNCIPGYYIIPVPYGYEHDDKLGKIVSTQSNNSLAIGANVSCELLPEDKVSIERDSTNYLLNVTHQCWNEGSTSNSSFLFDSSCLGTFFAGWAGESSQSPEETEATVLVCNSNMIGAEVSVTVMGNDMVTSYDIPRSLPESRIGGFVHTGDSRSDHDRLLAFEDAFQKSIITTPSMKWIDVIMAKVQPNVRQTGNATSMPDRNYVVEAFEITYKRLHAIYVEDVYRGDEEFTPRDPDFVIAVSLRYSNFRVSVSTPMFSISLAVLIFFLLLILWVHIVRPGRGLTHLPRSMADTFTLLYASDVMDDCARLRGHSTMVRGKQLDKLEDTYGYGMFKAMDGEDHFGVHKDSLDDMDSSGSEGFSLSEWREVPSNAKMYDG